MANYPNLETKDNARASLQSSIGATALSFTVYDNPAPTDSGVDDYSLLPTGPSDFPVFILTLEDEQILCYSRSGQTVTVYDEDTHGLGILLAGENGRGFASTTPTTHDADIIVYHNVCASVEEWLFRRVTADEDNLSTNYYTSAEIDALLESKNTKDPVECATTANITLSGTQTIDGVAVSADDRVLVKDQTDQKTNGIYVVASGAWSRSADCSTGEELQSALVPVNQGTSQANSLWLQVTDTVVIGVSNIVWSQVGVSLEKADQAEAEAGSDDSKYMTPLKTKQSIEANQNISDANATTLTGGSSSNATSLHYHKITTGFDSRAYNAGTGTQVITHGLGVIPKMIKIIANRKYAAASNGNTDYAESIGTAISTSSEQCLWWYHYKGTSYGSGPSIIRGNTTSYIIQLQCDSLTAIASVSEITSSTFTLNFTTFVNSAGANDNVDMLWEAYS